MAALLLGNEFGEPHQASAINYLRRAISAEDSEISLKVGQAFLFGSLDGRKLDIDTDAAVEAFLIASKLGNSKASAEVCSIFRSALYKRQDFAVAINYCLKAAEQGDRLSQTIAADLLFEHGQYPGDAEQAVQLYFDSALFGSNSGPMGLGKAYEMGVGVLQDYMLAHAWYNIASSRLSPGNRQEVAESMARIEKFFTAEQIIEAQALARKISSDMKSFSP
jgi:TPR repeat protein